MKVFFAQIYVEVGVTFPFSHHFQVRLSKEVSALVEPSSAFAKKFGADWNLIFRISAKRSLEKTEIRGPGVYRKAKDVEFTLFLPFDALQKETEVERAALRVLLSNACEVFEKLGISSARVEEKKESLVESICSDPIMFKNEEPNQAPEPTAPSGRGSS